MFFIEDFARLSGEFNKSFLFIGTLLIFGLLISSFISLWKANVKRLKKELVISAIWGVVPFTALIFNGLIFVVYFVGK